MLKEDGKLIMIEHVESKNRVIGKVMDFINPFVVKIVGVDINRGNIGDKLNLPKFQRVRDTLYMVPADVPMMMG